MVIKWVELMGVTYPPLPSSSFPSINIHILANSFSLQQIVSGTAETCSLNEKEGKSFYKTCNFYFSFANSKDLLFLLA